MGHVWVGGWIHISDLCVPEKTGCKTCIFHFKQSSTISYCVLLLKGFLDSSVDFLCSLLSKSQQKGCVGTREVLRARAGGSNTGMDYAHRIGVVPPRIMGSLREIGSIFEPKEIKCFVRYSTLCVCV